MPTRYIAKAGDSLCNIAYISGFGDCTALRSDPANAFILNRTDGPAEVRPGDVVTIPDQVVQQEGGGTDQRHEFVKRGTLATIRFVHGSPHLPYKDDLTLINLNVSNYVTGRGGAADGSQAFPDASVRRFNSAGHRDPDSFKVEVLDIRAAGDLQIKLEVLRPIYNAAGTVTGHEKFPAAIRADRELTAVASKQGSSKCFRTCYLRLVTDAADKGALAGQTLLASDMYDAGDARVEILDQVVKASYELQTCPNNPKCRATVALPIGDDRRRLRIAVHVLRQSAGGAPVVATAGAERRILAWLRRIYAQMSIAPKLMQPVRAVDPPENLVSISNDSGLTAAGDGPLGFRVNAAGISSQTIALTPAAAATPLTTAAALAAQLAAPFTAVVSQNPARFNDPVGRRSADIVITEAGGARVTIDRVVSSDSRQTLTVGRPNALTFQEWDGNNWLVGSIEQRTILKNYDTGDDRVDLFVIRNFIDPNLLGAAMMSGHRVDPQRSAITQVKWSAFVDVRSSDGTDTFPGVIAHEGMHVIAEVMHAQGAPRQVMHPTADQSNAVNTAKRVRDGGVTYDGGSIAGSHNLVNRMRSEGAPLLEGW